MRNEMHCRKLTAVIVNIFVCLFYPYDMTVFVNNPEIDALFPGILAGIHMFSECFSVIRMNHLQAKIRVVVKIFLCVACNP